VNRISNSKVTYIDPSARKQILENQEVILIALCQLMQNNSDRVAKDQSYRQTINKLIDGYHHTRKILGKDYIER